MSETKELNAIMQFDHVIRVHEDGTITDEPGIYAPDLFDGELDSPAWELMNGYSGQYSYSGPIMHESEFIGGAMERDIRNTPGVYVAIVGYSPRTAEDMDDLIGDELEIDGWAVATLTEDGTL